ncbi:MAG: AAA family ATPase [Myxococcales bacterium]|nr:AAA family ATPase [Myxococcales bacterium]
MTADSPQTDAQVFDLAGQLAPAFELLTGALPLDSVVAAADVKDQLRRLVVAWPGAQMVLVERQVGLPLSPLAPPLIVVSGAGGVGKTALAVALASQCQRPIARLRMDQLQRVQNASGFLAHAGHQLLQAEAIALVDIPGLADTADGHLFSALREFVHRRQFPVIIEFTPSGCGLPLWLRKADMIAELPHPDVHNRELLWELHLPVELPLSTDIDVPALAAGWSLNGGQIQRAVAVGWRLAVALQPSQPVMTMAQLRQGAQAQQAPLVPQRRQRTLTLDAIVASDATHEQLKAVALALRGRPALRAQWGTDVQLDNNNALFILLEGPIGCGKTWTAHALAASASAQLVPLPARLMTMDNDLARQRFLAEAAAAGAIVLCDDAEAGFARRPADSHGLQDLQNQQQLAELLRDLENYDGAVLFATGVVGSLDPALLRRLHIRVSFDELNPEQRAHCLRRWVPERAPLAADVDFADLGKKFDLPPARMRIAMTRAAMAAHAEGSPTLTLRHCDAALTAEAHAAGKVIWSGAGRKPERVVDDLPPDHPLRPIRRV